MKMQEAISYLSSRIPHDAKAPRTIEVILEAFSDKEGINDSLEDGKTILHCLADLAFPAGGSVEHERSVRNFQYDAICTLLDEGADPMALDRTGKTPLHYAVIRSNPLVVRRILTQNGSALYERDNDNCRSIDYIFPPRNEEDWENLRILLAKSDEAARQEFINAIRPDEWSGLEAKLMTELNYIREKQNAFHKNI